MSETQRAFWFGTIVGAFVVWGCLILVVALTTTAPERPARGDRLDRRGQYDALQLALGADLMPKDATWSPSHCWR